MVLAVRTDMAPSTCMSDAVKGSPLAKEDRCSPTGCKQRTVYRCGTPNDRWFDVEVDRAADSSTASRRHESQGRKRSFSQRLGGILAEASLDTLLYRPCRRLAVTRHRAAGSLHTSIAIRHC